MAHVQNKVHWSIEHAVWHLLDMHEGSVLDSTAVCCCH